jgi:ferrochelatase
MLVARPQRRFSTVRTAVVMLNMGGPPSLDGVNPFLKNLFSDPEIIPLGPLQPTLVCRRCT